ncbi:hypothetical protein AB0J43_21940, partial [Nonomuraea fuscirosea]
MNATDLTPPAVDGLAVVGLAVVGFTVGVAVFSVGTDVGVGVCLGVFGVVGVRETFGVFEVFGVLGGLRVLADCLASPVGRVEAGVGWAVVGFTVGVAVFSVGTDVGVG